MRYKNLKYTSAEELAKSFSSFIIDNEGKRSPHTINGYRQAIRLFSDFIQETKRCSFNDFGLEAFTQDNAYAFVKWLKTKRGVLDKTCNLRLSQLTAFLKYITKTPEFKKYYNDFRGVTRAKVPRKSNDQEPLPREAVKAIIIAAGQDPKIGLRYSIAIHMLYETAARISEFLSIRIRDLHLSEPKPYVSVIGKGAKKRIIYLARPLVNKLKKYIAREHGNMPDPDAFLFYSRTNGYKTQASPRGFNKQLEVYRKVAKNTCSLVPDSIHAHQFRRAKATHLLEDGMNIYQISKFLGHESVETTMIYLSFSIKMKEDTLKKLESSSLKGLAPKWKKDTAFRDLF